MHSNEDTATDGDGQSASSDGRIEGIDHVELAVPDPEAAARWYGDVFGLETLERFEPWAEGAGPLVVSSDDGRTMLALFEGPPDTDGEVTGFHRVAFRTDAGGFLAALDRLADRDDVAVGGRADAIDHDLSYSVYFSDPWGYPFEVTTYEYDAVAADLGSA